MKSRRDFFKIIVGTVVAASLPIPELARKAKVLSRGEFERFAIPLIQRVSPRFIAQELIPVQPMDRPVGLAFHMTYHYSWKDRLRNYLTSIFA